MIHRIKREELQAFCGAYHVLEIMEIYVLCYWWRWPHTCGREFTHWWRLTQTCFCIYTGSGDAKHILSSYRTRLVVTMNPNYRASWDVLLYRWRWPQTRTHGNTQLVLAMNTVLSLSGQIKCTYQCTFYWKRKLQYFIFKWSWAVNTLYFLSVVDILPPRTEVCNGMNLSTMQTNDVQKVEISKYVFRLVTRLHVLIIQNVLLHRILHNHIFSWG